MKRLLLFLALTCACYAQVNPQISGSGAPSNPCANPGQIYLDTSTGLKYSCPANGSNWNIVGTGQFQTQAYKLLLLPSDPTCAVVGQTWYNTTSDGAKICNNALSAVAYATGGAGNPAGLTTQFQFNDAGSFGGASNVLYTKATGVSSFNQKADTNDTFYSKRFTDTTPTGSFLHFQNAAANADLFKVDVLGAVTATSFSTLGGSVAGIYALGAGTVPSLPANTASWIGAATTTTAYGITMPTAEPSSACLPHWGAASSHVAAMTCSAVVGSDMTNNTVTATQLAAQYSKGSCTEVWGGSGTSFALTSGDDAISNNSCYNDSGVTRTITAVKCASDNGTNTTTVNPTFGAAGTGTTILSGALTCGSSNAMSSSGTVSNASWTTGAGINPAMGGTLTGTHIVMIVEYTY